MEFKTSIFAEFYWFFGDHFRTLSKSACSSSLYHIIERLWQRAAVPIDRRDGAPVRRIELARIPVDVRVCPHGFPTPDQELRRRIVQPPPDALLQLDRDEHIPGRSPRRGHGDGRHISMVAVAEVATEYG